MTRIAIIGEAMLELSHPEGQGTRLAYGGDTLNTAVYLARLGHAPYFVTALGRDPYSDGLVREWERECVQTRYVLRHPSRLPGLYAIQTDHLGERRFYYWRSESAARALFCIEQSREALAFASEADWLYLSGITLSIFRADDRARLEAIARRVVQRGGEVAFDPNYRPAGWPSPEVAREAIASFAGNVTLALPTLDDENALHGQAPGDVHAARWHALGVRQVVMKCGPRGAIWYPGTGDQPVEIVVDAPVQPMDTTGAGDSFNAAYIAARIDGFASVEAARRANRLAGTVIQHAGAIIPRAAMPDFESVS